MLSVLLYSFILPKTFGAILPPTYIISPTNPTQQIYYELTPRRKAFLDLIAYTEGTDRSIDRNQSGYNILYSYQTFIPGKSHPNRVICANNLCSSAAGRYQILNFTYFNLQQDLLKSGFLPFPSFAPQYQDQMALYLIDKKRRCLDAIDREDLTKAFLCLSYEWASLPPGIYGQPIVSKPKAIQVYYYYLGIHQRQ